MTEIIIEQPGIFRRKIRMEVPDRWRELSPRQFSATVRIYTEAISEDDFLAEYFDLSKKLISRLDALCKYRLLELTDFARTPREACDHFKLKRIRWFCAPTPQLREMSMMQFIAADSFFDRYMAHQTPEKLARFVAALYLPDGVAFWEVDFDRHCKRIATHAKPHFQNMVFLNWVLIKNYLSKLYGSLFEPGPEPTEPATTSKKKPAGTTWVQIMDNFVGENVHNQDAIHRPNCDALTKA